MEDAAASDRAPPAGGGGHRRPAARQPAAAAQRTAHPELRLPHHAAHRLRRARPRGSRALRVAAGRRRAAARCRHPPRPPLGLALGAAFLALFVHALSYSGFLEDPITWVVLGRGLARGSCLVAPRRGGGRRERLNARAWALLGLLLALVAITLPELGSDPWPFRPGAVDPQGPLAPLVRAAGEEWDVGIARAACFVAALVCAAAALTLLRLRSWPALGRRRRRARGGPAAARPLNLPPGGTARPPHPGSSPTTPPTRSSSAASCYSTATTPTATTTAGRAWSASTRSTAPSRSVCSTARWRSSTTPTSPAHS